MICISGKYSDITDNDFSHPFDIIFIPIASPVVVENRMKSNFPANFTLISFNLAYLDVESNACLIIEFPSLSIQALASAALVIFGNSEHGPRVISSFVMTVVTPVPALIALHPRAVEATKQPSVVAIG